MILVTGANGFSGSAVIREFARQHSPVRALVRSRAKAQVLERLPSVELAEGDMQRPETLAGALSGVDCALLISSPDQQMVETQSAFIDAAKQAGVRHIVKFWGLNASVASPFLFNRMHAEIEGYLERSGVTWTHLRPRQFMPEYVLEGPTIIAESAFFLPREDAKLAPVDMEDIAKAAFALLHTSGYEGKRYEMTGPEAGVPGYIADALDVQASERRRGATGEAVVHAETHTALGIRPTTFAEFARRNAAVFRGEVMSSRPGVLLNIP